MAKRKRHRKTHTHSWSRLPEQQEEEEQDKCHHHQNADYIVKVMKLIDKELSERCVVFMNWVRSSQLLGEQVTP